MPDGTVARPAGFLRQPSDRTLCAMPAIGPARIRPAGGSAGLTNWCGREDSNFHGVSPTATSTLRGYQFRHDRIRPEEHTSDPVTNAHLVCRRLLETQTM